MIPINIIVAPGFAWPVFVIAGTAIGCSSTGSAAGTQSRTSAAASSGSNNAPPRGKELTTAAQPQTRQARTCYPRAWQRRYLAGTLLGELCGRGQVDMVLGDGARDRERRIRGSDVLYRPG